ncbi:unnamed protein product [Bubo scandiacus]
MAAFTAPPGGGRGVQEAEEAPTEAPPPRPGCLGTPAPHTRPSPPRGILGNSPELQILAPPPPIPPSPGTSRPARTSSASALGGAGGGAPQAPPPPRGWSHEGEGEGGGGKRRRAALMAVNEMQMSGE